MITRDWGQSTTAIHAGRPRPETHPVGQQPFRSRWGDADLDALAASLAALEKADRALVTSSGQSAYAVLFETLLKRGSHLVVPAGLCPSTARLLQHWVAHRGLKVTWIPNALDLAAWERAIRDETVLLLAASPANPTLAITDLAGIAELGRRRGIRTVADNTFATPVFTRPLELGIDLSVADANPFLGGHGDLAAGVIAGSEEAITACAAVARLTESGADPMSAWLLQRGLKTLHLRMMRAADNAQTLAAWLLWQPQVARVDFPGVKEHPGHAVAVRQMTGGFGAMLNFELAGGLAAGQKFCGALEIIAREEHPGGLESLIQHPASQDQARLPPDAKALGISDGLLRLSVGIEDAADLKLDLERGFLAVG